MGTELITVLDVDTRDEALDLVDRCGKCAWFKVGFQLFTRCGPDVVRAIQDRGKNVFLDLKFHDIPNTVAQGARAAVALNAGLFTLHTSGGRAMMEAAAKAVAGSPTRILGVTILTSLSDEALRDEVGMPETAAAAVARLGALAVNCGVHGLVCSPHEIASLRQSLGAGVLIVTPGVRPEWAGADDQQRVMTPRQAAAAGADFIVVGRPIVRHNNPAEAVDRILEELA